MNLDQFRPFSEVDIIVTHPVTRFDPADIQVTIEDGGELLKDETASK